MIELWWSEVNKGFKLRIIEDTFWCCPYFLCPSHYMIGHSYKNSDSWPHFKIILAITFNYIKNLIKSIMLSATSYRSFSPFKTPLTLTQNSNVSFEHRYEFHLLNFCILRQESLFVFFSLKLNYYLVGRVGRVY